MIGASELKGLMSILPTPAKPGAERMDAVDTVDLDESARVVEQLIKDGVGGIMALGTMGECATTSQDDYEKFVDCILSTAKKRVPMFIGTTALGSHEVARRIRFVQELGADGTLLGMPMWQPLTDDGAVKYFAEISETFPDFAIMVYANSRAFRHSFGIDFWKGIGEKAPTVMSSKFGGRDILKDVIVATHGRVNLIPNDGAAYAFAEISPETTTACWSATMGPRPATAMMNAIATGDMARAKEISDELHWAGEPIRPYVSSFEVFAQFNIQLEKVRMEEAGYVKAGPMRPPYNYMPKEMEEAARENGRRFAQLEQKYAAMVASAVGGGES
jgi:dihydrodipicolinate synthase/N-acetylneuraminate lyase